MTCLSRGSYGVCLAIMGRSFEPDQVDPIQNQPNMFRVKILDNETRKNLVLNSKKLKDNPNYKNVYVSRDLTFMQRQELRARRTLGRSESTTHVSTANGAMAPHSFSAQGAGLGQRPDPANL